MVVKRLSVLAVSLLLAACTAVPSRLTLGEGDGWTSRKEYTDFEITGQARTEEGSGAVIRLCQTAEQEGYEVLLQNGPIDGNCRTGSLLHVRNLYRSLAADGEWFDFSVAVQGKNIGVRIGDVDVVCYTEPEEPWRAEAHRGQRIAPGRIGLAGLRGKVAFRDLRVTPLPAGSRNPADTLPPVDEQQDGIIRLQQRDFPVIDYHVHLKGDLTKEMAHAMSMNYGIKYGVAPNAGEGGVGRMLADDAEVYAYHDEITGEPFLFGVQGEGRKWTQTFSQEALGIFEYLFTDAMTIIDHKGRNSRIYRPKEVFFDGISKEAYMDHLVDQTVLILPSCRTSCSRSTTGYGRPNAWTASWTSWRSIRLPWRSIPATGFPASTSSARPRNGASGSPSGPTTWTPGSGAWNTPWRPSRPAA